MNKYVTRLRKLTKNADRAVMAFGTVIIATPGQMFARVRAGGVATPRAPGAPEKLSQRLARLRDRLEAMSAPSLSIKEQMFFVKRLSFLIKANVPILEGLHMVNDQTKPGGHKRIIEAVIRDVSNGQSLSKSFGKFPQIFGDFGINIVKVGESSGTLSANLEYLADDLKKNQSLRQKVVGAFIYPAVITVATLGITAFLMLYLFPKIMPVFLSLHMTLPLTTRIVMATSVFLQHWWLATLIGIAAAVTAAAFGLRMSLSFRYLVESILLKLPFIGIMLRELILANTTRTLGLLLKSGITLSQAVPLTADTTQNLVYKKELNALSASVARGEQVAVFLRKNPNLFPAIMTQLIAVGERSGNLSNTLLYLSELYESEVDDFTKNLSSLIEPALMVVMGVLVGFIAVSIITPIYGITQNLHA
jgi:type II secretory pathway component PulF